MADVEANRVAQREIYGEPLRDIVDRCRAVLGLSQARVATVLGMSAPMLSQVMTGHRIKIGNPAAAQRLRVLVEVSDHVAAGRLDVETALEQVRAAGSAGEVLTGTSRRTSRLEAAELVQASFRRRVGATDVLAAARAIEDRWPEIADLLRAYGAGRVDDAVALLGDVPSAADR